MCTSSDYKLYIKKLRIKVLISTKVIPKVSSICYTLYSTYYYINEIHIIAHLYIYNDALSIYKLNLRILVASQVYELPSILIVNKKVTSDGQVVYNCMRVASQELSH